MAGYQEKQTDKQIVIIFDRLRLKLSRMPTVRECLDAGCIGATGRIVELRHEWAVARGIAHEIQRGGKKRVSPSLANQRANVNAALDELGPVKDIETRMRMVREQAMREMRDDYRRDHGVGLMKARSIK